MLNQISETEFWVKQKEYLFCFTRQREHMLSKLCIPIQEDLVESFIAMVPGEGEVADKDQSMCRACSPLIWPQVVS